ncbi:MAG: winged helix-turn-helix domain-containing protein [Salinigranum sp.]
MKPYSVSTMGVDWEVASYVLRSHYRVAVVRTIASGGPATPSQIAVATGRPQPHVSRALSELSDRGVVELLVPEEQVRGRYYGLTDVGDDVWVAIEDEVPAVELLQRDPETDVERELLSVLHARVGDSLRLVAHYHGHVVEALFLRPDLREDADGEDFRARVRRFTEVDRDDHGENAVAGSLRYELRVYEAMTTVRLSLGRREGFVASFDPIDRNSYCPVAEACHDVIGG